MYKIGFIIFVVILISWCIARNMESKDRYSYDSLIAPGTSDPDGDWKEDFSQEKWLLSMSML